MTWNIRTGGRDRGDESRLDRVIRVVTEQRPDVLALQELRDFGRDGRMARFATAVGMRPYLARHWSGQPVAVLVRPPARATAAASVRRPFHHAAQRVVLSTDVGPLTVLSAHLYPYSGLRRLIEARWLISAAAGAPDRLLLLMGDLNSLDPWAGHDARLAALPAAYRRRHLRRDSRTVDTRVITALDRAGLVDLFRRVGTGDPQTAPTRHGGGAEFSAMRLDYLFGSPRLAERARSCRVLRGGETEYASDHYPLLAELDLAVG